MGWGISVLPWAVSAFGKWAARPIEFLERWQFEDGRTCMTLNDSPSPSPLAAETGPEFFRRWLLPKGRCNLPFQGLPLAGDWPSRKFLLGERLVDFGCGAGTFDAGFRWTAGGISPFREGETGPPTRLYVPRKETSLCNYKPLGVFTGLREHNPLGRWR